jgi:hypothetical protein
MMVIELEVIQPSFAKPLLVVDDFRGPPDRVSGTTSHQPFGAFPTEAILDSLMHARGGMPWQYQPLGRTTSDPGMFAGFDHDSLDSRFFPFNGLPLSVISEYQAVVWFTSAEDAGRRGGKFTSNDPMSALRFVNTIGELNTLAVYSEMGGMVWLFGDGVCLAVANGYVSRYPGQAFASFPYKLPLRLSARPLPDRSQYGRIFYCGQRTGRHDPLSAKAPDAGCALAAGAGRDSATWPDG